VRVQTLQRLLGFKTIEVPVRWNHVDGSKVGMFNGIHAFKELADVRFNDLMGYYK